MDWTVNIGQIGTIGAIIFAAGGFYYGSQRMKLDITEIKADLKMLNKVVMDVALQNQRIDNLEHRIDERFGALEHRWDEVRRGEGLIRERA